MIPALIFAGTYLVLSAGRLPYVRIDRTGAAVVGAILMVVAGGLPLTEAYAAIDYRTIVLLFGMMILIASLRLARFFRITARWIVARVRHPAAIVFAVVFASGILSGLFVNDTICLVFTPILIEVAEARGQKPVPLLLALATASNIGSVATMTGNPQNMLIGSMSRIGYVPFARTLTPVALVGLLLDALLIYVIFRADLHATQISAPVRRIHPVHRGLMAKTLAVAAGVMAGFLAGLEPALVSAAAAAVLLVSRTVNPQKFYRGVDWDLLMLFIGLFVVVAGIERAGIDDVIFAWLAPVGIATIGGLTVVAAVLSNVISNVPAVMLFTRLVPSLPDPHSSWLTLAMASTLAGNLTLLGSLANLIVLESARRRGVRLAFGDFLKVGPPVTLLTLAFGVWWLS
ncbi:MAG TPA: anion transporter [Gemmatimonadaceae bacterium]